MVANASAIWPGTSPISCGVRFAAWLGSVCAAFTAVTAGLFSSWSVRITDITAVPIDAAAAA